ncbi:MAG: hypothetical protein AUG49_15975 [Catenulispora sp. 13_1_20CM_3_70_7]|nr:MAG: hypothetical protein AUG49_15975 [Catenulispora sp. 13_1_20CM_3_70_7]
MLFEASTTYAPGEEHGDVGYSRSMDMSQLARYHLTRAAAAPRLWIGIAGLAAVAWLVHTHRGGRS